MDTGIDDAPLTRVELWSWLQSDRRARGDLSPGVPSKSTPLPIPMDINGHGTTGPASLGRR